VTIDAYGASGASCIESTCGSGGLGGHIQAIVAVTAGAILAMNIDMAGTTSNPSGGWNGGGSCVLYSNPTKIAGGRGGTDVRVSGAAYTSSHIVAGGVVGCCMLSS